VTADLMVDALEDLWPLLKLRFNPHTIVINADNGPENSSRRTQLINRLVEFSATKQIDIDLAYYPPYHSKYNPIERVWGGVERHWNGDIEQSALRADCKQYERLNTLTLEGIRFYNFLYSNNKNDKNDKNDKKCETAHINLL
jgi:transposase